MYDFASDARDGSGEKVASVRFLKSAAPYREGEVAGFPIDQAKLIIEKRIGEFVEEVEREVETPDGRKVKKIVWERTGKPNLHTPAFSKGVEDAPNKMQQKVVTK